MYSTVHRNRIVLLHASFWCAYISFFLYQFISRQRGPEIDWSPVLTAISVQVVFASLIGYLNYFIFLPAFLRDRKLGRYIVLFVATFALFITVRIGLERELFEEVTGGRGGFLFSNRYIIHLVSSNLFTVIFLGMVRFAVDWFELESRQKNIENERLTAELNFLKAQINPHFLFNTLNNLYYLAYSKSEKTTEVIAKLSQMMRYMIYDSNYPLVPLVKEIEYMENYISLERLRLNNEIPITFSTEGENIRDLLIAPLIFITFLENAFKHGVSNSHPGAWINISIVLQGGECVYRVENSKLSNPTGGADKKSGFGLQNVRRRLELSYPDRYTLDIKDLPDRYSVQLNIQLS